MAAAGRRSLVLVAGCLLLAGCSGTPFGDQLAGSFSAPPAPGPAPAPAPAQGQDSPALGGPRQRSLVTAMVLVAAVATARAEREPDWQTKIRGNFLFFTH